VSEQHTAVEAEFVDETTTAIVKVDTSVATALARNETEAQIDVARKYPRSVKRFMADAITLATLDQEIAESCIYTLPRGDKPISGPSIRLAEICASAYGNIHIGARVVGVEEKEIVAQGVTWDLEKNVRVTIETRRRITDKNGRRYKDDMVTVTGNAAASIALRNSVFRVIPKAFVNKIYAQARAVAVGSASTLAERRATVFERLQKMGAFKERILARISKPSIEDVTIDDIETLIGLGTAIKSGDATVDETFPAPVVEKVKLNVEDLRAGKEENRGHGNEGIGPSSSTQKPTEQKPPAEQKPAEQQQSKTTKQEAKPKAPAPVVETKPGVYEEAPKTQKQTAAPSAAAPAAAAQSPAPPAQAEAPADETKCAEQHFEKMEAAANDVGLGHGAWYKFIRETLKYKKTTDLKVKDFDRVMRFITNGGTEAEGGTFQ
jgi:hypothetical protein